jgi:transcriptional regulator with XRE-family HTH domain
MTLGKILKKARARKGLSLRKVQDEVKISNGFLSQIESDKVKNPSPHDLHKLAHLYGLSYSALMDLAGYPSGDRGNELTTAPSGGGLCGAEDLTSEEQQLVEDYIQLVRDARCARGM